MNDPSPSGVVIGTISNWMGNREFPENEEHVDPDGRLLKVNDYPELFNLIAYSYGGSGEEFRIPDFISKVPIGEIQSALEDPRKPPIPPPIKTLMRIK